MRLSATLAGLTLAGVALVATTCLVGIPDLEEQPVAGSDAGVAGSAGSAAGGSGAAAGSGGGIGAGGAGGTAPSYYEEVMADSPIGYWRFGETGGTTAHNEVVGGLDGTYRDGVTLGHAGAIAGDSNTAARFDGYGSMAVPDDDHVFDFDHFHEFTLEGWFRRESGGGANLRLLGKELQLSDPLTGYGVWSSGNDLRFFRAVDGGADEVVAEDVTGTYVFAYIVAVYDAPDMHLYVDGVEVGTAATSTIYVPNHWGSFGVGAPTTSGTQQIRFIGIADEIAVYDDILSEERILAHYRAGRPR